MWESLTVDSFTQRDALRRCMVTPESTQKAKMEEQQKMQGKRSTWDLVPMKTKNNIIFTCNSCYKNVSFNVCSFIA
jgi:hypothetical protein